MKPIIGILLREKEYENRNIMGVNKEISDMIIKFGGIPLGIFPNYLENFIDNQNQIKMNNEQIEEIKKIIDFCNGIILPGGNDFYDIDLNIIKYVYDKDIPCLGICAGMQAMGFNFNGKIGHINNNKHNKKNNYVHSVNIKKYSKIYNIIKKSYILVNSRHNDCIVYTDLDIVGKCDDVIEAIEDKKKKFFIGLQWHPESMILYDENNKKIIEEFIIKAS